MKTPAVLALVISFSSLGSAALAQRPSVISAQVAMTATPSPMKKAKARGKNSPLQKTTPKSGVNSSTVLNGATGAGKPGTGGPGASAGTNSNGTNGANGPIDSPTSH